MLSELEAQEYEENYIQQLNDKETIIKVAREKGTFYMEGELQPILIGSNARWRQQGSILKC